MTRLSFCGDQVRRYDNDRYLTALLAPADRREALFALYAFNLEVAKTREAVSEPMVGQIRLQWWREAIEGLYAGDVRPHEVVRPLAEAIDRFALGRALFDRLIDAREADLDATPPATYDDLERYAAGTSSSLMMLALEVLGATGEAAGRAAHHAGVAWALVGLLRALVFHGAAKRQYLPDDLMRAAGADLRDLFELRGSAALVEVVKDVAERARAELAQARAERPAVPRAALPALLPAILADAYLRRMARQDYDLFARPIELSQPYRQWRLLRAHLSGRF